MRSARPRVAAPRHGAPAADTSNLLKSHEDFRAGRDWLAKYYEMLDTSK